LGQLWTFTGPAKVSSDDCAREVYWVAAESVDEALRYLRQRYDDLQIMEARCAGMVAILSGSPLDGFGDGMAGKRGQRGGCGCRWRQQGAAEAQVAPKA
jgi:hypothetical protein